MPPTQQPDLEVWRALYDAAIRLKALAPWQWMFEDQVFGVEDPESGRVGFVSIMGALGEHLGLSAYLDAEGLHQFWELTAQGDRLNPLALFEIGQLTASFEDRRELTDEDREIIKKLGLRFRGRHAWPMFRKIDPGYLPWHLEEADARFLTHIIEQTIDVTRRLRDNPNLLTSDQTDSHRYLIRVPRRAESGWVWEDVWREIPPPEDVTLYIDDELLAAAKTLPRSSSSIEMDLFPMLPPVVNDQGRPFIPYVLLMLDKHSGMLLAPKLLAPEPSLLDMKAHVPIHILESFVKFGGIPDRIDIQDEFLELALELLSEEGLPIRYRVRSKLKRLERAKQELMEFMR